MSAPDEQQNNTAGRMRPAINEDTAFFWAEVNRHRFAIQRCGTCGTLRHPPSPGCTECQSMAWDYVIAKGAGTVHSYTVIHHPAVGPFTDPNCVGLIDLDEGVRVISQIVDADPESIAIGMKVQMHFEEVEPGLTLPLFRPSAP